MNRKIAVLATALLAMAFASELTRADDPTTNRFLGGSFDGWDGCAMSGSLVLGETLVSLSSGADQVFAFNVSPALHALTIAAEEPAGEIAAGGTLRIGVPTDWPCSFDVSSSLTLSGTTGKVGMASYEDGGRTLSIPVTVDFLAGDELTVTGLRLTNLHLVSSGVRYMELDFTGDGVRDVYDLYSVTVRAQWPGGSFDGWDVYAIEESFELMPADGGLLLFFR